MKALAARLEHRHSDRWLRDLLLESEQHQDTGDGLRLLSEAVSLNQTSDRERARARALQAAILFHKLGNRAGWERARFEIIYADHLAHEGQSCYAPAKSLASQADASFHSWLRIQFQLEISACADMIGRPEESRLVLEAALRLASEARYEILNLRASVFLSILNFDLGDSAATLSIAARGLNRYWSGSYPAMRGYSFYAAMGNAAEDLQLWSFQAATDREALKTLAGDPDTVLRAIKMQRLARALLMAGNLQEAEDNFQQSETLFASAPHDDPQRNLLAEAEIGLAEAELQRGEARRAIQRLERVQPDLSAIADSYIAFDFFSTLGQALIQMGESAKAEEALRSAFQPAEQNLRSLGNEREGLTWVRRIAPAYRSIVRVKAATDPAQAFAWWEWFLSASLRARASSDDKTALRGGAGTPTLPSLPKEWKSDAVVVSYALYADRLLIWVFAGRGVQQQQIAIRKSEIELLARHFTEHCAQPESNLQTVQSEARQLYQLLVAPVAPWLKGYRHLVIEADGALDSVAFEALVKEDGSYLGDRYSISFSPAVQYLAAAHTAGKFSSQSHVLVVADPEPPSGGSLGPLPDAEQEARSIIDRFSNARLLWRSQATRKEIARWLPEAEIFHFTGHAVATAGMTSLVLHDDGPDRRAAQMSAIELDRSALMNSRLVVLSACATAQGTNGILNDRESLARTLVAAGVPQVVASRWQVDSATTTSLMAAFYGRLAEGVPATEALRQSAAFIREQKGKSHPYYWSAFALFGKD